ncbi:hypothetical protein [Enterobacter roggenkampii]|uniref:hypothetical protein n=1 Tax=Enterobacter roggenkampii TaxID=1812935 RepID=UPI00084CD74A|nr:hypothetical protein [Enterobacter roggenkampii]AOP97951.1 hypothetical protein BFV67_22475 [Enterobacter roggenkampii]QWZ75449.1 hypothetical protein I6L60_22720 [Enterobacter roggenkampii]
MFVRRKNYELVLSRYELAASRADRAEQKLALLYGTAMGRDGLYKCLLECREAAMALMQPGAESAVKTMERLAFIDKRLSELLPLLTEEMTEGEKQRLNAMLESRSAERAYGPSYWLAQEESP